MKKLSGAVRTLQRGVRRYLLFQKSMVRVESVHSILGEEGESDLILIDKNDMENGSGNKIDYEIDQMCLSTDNLLKSGVDTGTDDMESETINIHIGVENPTEPNTDEDTLIKNKTSRATSLIPENVPDDIPKNIPKPIKDSYDDDSDDEIEIIPETPPEEIKIRKVSIFGGKTRGFRFRSKMIAEKEREDVLSELKIMLLPLHSFFLRETVSYFLSAVRPGSEALVKFCFLLTVQAESDPGSGSGSGSESESEGSRCLFNELSIFLFLLSEQTFGRSYRFNFTVPKGVHNGNLEVKDFQSILDTLGLKKWDNDDCAIAGGSDGEIVDLVSNSVEQHVQCTDTSDQHVDDHEAGVAVTESRDGQSSNDNDNDDDFVCHAHIDNDDVDSRSIVPYTAPCLPSILPKFNFTIFLNFFILTQRTGRFMDLVTEGVFPPHM